MNELCEFEAAVSAALGVDVRVDKDGEMQRFSTNGKRGDLAGWLIFHGDHGAFGDWRTGYSGTWVAGDRDRQSWRDPGQRHAREREQLARINGEAQKWLEAATRAKDLWGRAEPIPTNDEPGGHSYLRRKMVEPHGIRQLNGSLLIPLRDDAGRLWSLQFINVEGRKLFLKGGRTKQLYHVIEGRSDSVGVCEGYATGAAVFKMTGATVYCACSSHNLRWVTSVACALHGRSAVVVFGDDDKATPGNPGRTNAMAAVQPLGVRLALPDFTRFWPHNHPKPTDSNDYLLMEEGQWLTT